MSVTFWMDQAPVERIAPYADEPDYYEVRPVEPFTEMNVSNVNAAALMRLVDPSLISEDGVFGTWEVKDMPEIRQRIIWVLATKAKEAAYVDPFIRQEPGRCKVFHGGRDEEYVSSRLTSLCLMLATAMEHGFSVSIG